MRASFPVSLPAVIIIGLLASGCDKQTPAAPQPNAPRPIAESEGTIDEAKRGSAMPGDRFAAPDGKPARLVDFTGQPLLVNLWATWCGPCVREMPSLDRLAARMRGRLRVLVVNQDTAKQAVDPVPAWWKKAALTNLSLYRDGDNNLGFAYGGGMLPTSVLYDASGREVARVVGGMDWDTPRATALIAKAGAAR